MKKKLLFVFLSLLTSSALWAADGDTFTANTVEGVEMTFTVISESEKTCYVGTGMWGETAIDKETDGSVTIPTEVEGYKVFGINSSAFEGCTKLSGITLPEGMTYIDTYAFSGCIGLTTITIPSSVTNLGWGVFSGCNNLESIISLITTPFAIDTYTFSRDKGCVCIYVPTGTSVSYQETVGWNTNFSYTCENLELDDVIPFYDETVKQICVDNWDKDGDGELSLKEAGEISSFNRRFENSEIGNFRELMYFTGLTKIDDATFKGCSLLFAINLPDGIDAIGDFAFDGCSNLTNIIIPNTVKSIGKYAFQNCSNVTLAMPTNLKIIDDYAFYSCNNLSNITFPESLEYIGYKALDNTGWYNNLPYPYSGELMYIGKIAYRYRGSMLYAGGDIAIKEGTISIAGGALSGQNSLNSVALPNSLKTIGSNAFSACDNLTEIVIPNSVTNIGDDAFAYCKSLHSINIPESVTEIGNFAFRRCENIESIIFSEGVRTIGQYAFDGCWNLTELTIPSSALNIHEGTFRGCTAISSVTSYLLNPNRIDSFDNNSNATLYIPIGTRELYESKEWTQFFSSVVEMELDKSEIITFADNQVEEICVSNWDYNGDGKISKNEAKSVKSLGTHFKYSYIQFFDELQYFTGLTEISDYAFYDCSYLSSFMIPNGVVSIGNSAFQGCYHLLELHIPGSLKSISNNAFQSCESLSAIVVDDANMVYDSRNSCNAIIKTQDNTLILGCNNTTIPEGIVALGDYAFYGNGITSISIPASTTKIGEQTFRYCSNLESISVEDGNSVFDSRNNCNAIIETRSNKLILGCKSTIIPDDVTIIVESAFVNMSKSQTIPASVTEIGYSAFNYTCQNVFSKITEPFDTQGFYDMGTSSSTLYVPQGTRDAYMNCEGWSDFGKIIEVAPVQVTLAKNTITYASEQMLDFSIPIDGLKAYVISEVNYEGKAMLSEVNTAVGAGVGLILRGTAGTTYEIPSTMDVPNKISNLLIGVTEDTQIGLGGGFFWDPYYEEWIWGSCSDYILSDGKFVKASEGTLKAGKAFLSLPYYFNSRELILFDADATGIREAKNANNNSSDNYYNLNGQRVSTPQKGLYIVNEKKVIKK